MARPEETPTVLEGTLATTQVDAGPTSRYQYVVPVSVVLG
jgi:hypothetical protein